jgi:XTP/dITP diphosphohydrolase
LPDSSGHEICSGDGATWPERRASLRAELAAGASQDRSARFVCALHFIAEDGRAVAVEADIIGTIADRDLGTAGFSYDPTFWYPPAGKTFGELTEPEKDRISNRARAVAALLEALRAESEIGMTGFEPADLSLPKRAL